jgi:hypothetical protein
VHRPPAARIAPACRRSVTNSHKDDRLWLNP